MDASLQIDVPGKRSRPLNLVRLLLRKGMRMLSWGVALALVTLPFSYAMRKPHYSSTGRLLIIPEVKLILDGQEQIIEGNFHDFADTCAERLKRPVIAFNALSDLPRTRWPDFVRGIPDVRVAAAILSRRIKLTPIGRSYVLEVSIAGTEPEGLPETVDSVMHSFVRYLEQEQSSVGYRRLAYLTLEAKRLKDQLREQEEEQSKLFQQLGNHTASPERNPFYDLLIQVQSVHVRAKADATAQQTLLQGARRDQELLATEDLASQAAESVAASEQLSKLDHWTYTKLQQLRAGIDGLANGNQDRASVEARMAATSDFLRQFRKDLETETLTLLEKKRAHELAQAVTEAENSAKASADLEASLARQLDEAQQAFAWSSTLLTRVKELTDEVDSIRNHLVLIHERIREVQLECKLPVHVGIDSLATTAEGASGTDLTKLLATNLICCLAIVFSAFFLQELADTRVRDVTDLSAALGALPSASVPLFDGPTCEKEFTSCVRELPSHPCSVAIHALAVRLNQYRNASPTVILLCGGSKSAGVSWLCRNVADALTLYVGKVLILHLEESHQSTVGRPPEASFQHYCDCALSEIAANPDPVTLLQLEPDTPLMRRRDWLRDFVSTVSPAFDFVLIDARPLIGSDLTAYLTDAARVVVVVARQGFTRYGDVRKSIELLARLQAPEVTAVLVGETEQPEKRIAKLTRWAVECFLPERFQAVLKMKPWLRG